MYRFDHDTVANILHITGEGFWDLSGAIAFGVAAVARGSAIRLRHGHFAVLCDVRAMPIQSGPVADAIAMLMPKTRLLTSGPMAIVSAGTLNKLQIDRIMASAGVRSFLDYDQAVAWLDAEWTARRAA